MSIKSTLLASIMALVLILALGVACEGEDVTREDVEEALEEALGTDVDIEEVEQAARDALTDGTEDVATSSRTSLHLAAARGTAAEVQALLDEGAELDARDEDGRTPLSHAASSNDEPAVALALLDAGADIEARDQTVFGDTPLHWAVQYGTAPVVKALLDRGANIEAKNDRGTKPLGAALFNDTSEMAELLLTRGADPNAGLYLHSAARANDVALTTLLLEHGADIDGAANITVDGNPWNDITPLHIATLNSNLDVVELLLDRGATINTWTPDGWSPVMFAILAEAGDDVVNLLLERGASRSKSTHNSRRTHERKAYCAGGNSIVRFDSRPWHRLRRRGNRLRGCRPGRPTSRIR